MENTPYNTGETPLYTVDIRSIYTRIYKGAYTGYDRSVFTVVFCHFDNMTDFPHRRCPYGRKNPGKIPHNGRCLRGYMVIYYYNKGTPYW